MNPIESEVIKKVVKIKRDVLNHIEQKFTVSRIKNSFEDFNKYI